VRMHSSKTCAPFEEPVHAEIDKTRETVITGMIIGLRVGAGFLIPQSSAEEWENTTNEATVAWKT
jgi:hypothetical protein